MLLDQLILLSLASCYKFSISTGFAGFTWSSIKLVDVALRSSSAFCWCSVEWNKFFQHKFNWKKKMHLIYYCHGKFMEKAPNYLNENHSLESLIIWSNNQICILSSVTKAFFIDLMIFPVKTFMRLFDNIVLFHWHSSWVWLDCQGFDGIRDSRFFWIGFKWKVDGN